MKKRCWFILIGILTVSAVLGSWLPFRMTIDIDNSFISIKNSIARAAEPEVGEIVDARTETSKTYYRGDGDYKLEAYIGAIHYREGGAWLDIDTDYSEADTGDYTARFTKIPYIVRMGDDSGRRIYPDRDDTSYWIHLYKPFESMGTPSKYGGYWYWDFPHAIIAVRVCNTSVKFAFRMKDDQCPNSITIPFDTEGITRQGSLLYHDGEVVAQLQKPIAIDANGVERDCDAVFNTGEVTISLDTSGLVYPIDVDPTVDVDITAGGDDGNFTSSQFNSTNNYIVLGQSNVDNQGFFRFNGVTVSGTVNSANISLYSNSQQGDPELKIYGIDEDNPDAPTDATEANADPLTDAAVDWDGVFIDEDWNFSPSLVSIIQELVDSYEISSEAVMIQIRDDQASNSQNNQVRSYEWSSAAYVARLQIDYTTGGTPDISNDTSSEPLGIVSPSTTYYAKGTAPNNPVESGDCTFTITNSSGFAVDLTIEADDFTGGTTWYLGSGSPDATHVRVTAYYEGQNPASGVVLSTSPQSFYSSLADSGTLKWDFKFESAAFDIGGADQTQKTSNITITASAS